MHFKTRPSKSFLFDVLEREIRRVEGGVGVDAACEKFKNRAMFRTNTYVGIDISLPSIRLGKEEYPSDRDIGIVASIAALSSLPSHSADLVVSTNTLDHLSVEERGKAIEELTRITAPTGVFLCELLLYKEFDAYIELLETAFEEVRVIYFKSVLSRLYELLFEKNGHFGDHALLSKLPFRMLAWGWGQLEYLTCRTRRLNKHAFIIARTKKGLVTKQPWQTNALSEIEPGIFDART